jgi:DNA-binding Xre family transcriptional regulator
MIRSNLPQIKIARERELGRKITYVEMKEHTGVSGNAIARLMRPGSSIDRIDGRTLEGVCEFFECTVGDLLEYVPNTTKLD